MGWVLIVSRLLSPPVQLIRAIRYLYLEIVDNLRVLIKLLTPTQHRNMNFNFVSAVPKTRMMMVESYG